MSHSSDHYNSEGEENEFQFDFLKNKKPTSQNVAEEEEQEEEQLNQNSERLTHGEQEDDNDSQEESQEEAQIASSKQQQGSYLVKKPSEIKITSTNKLNADVLKKFNPSNSQEALPRAAVNYQSAGSLKNGTLKSNKNDFGLKSSTISSKQQSQNFKEKIDPLNFDSDLEEIPNNQEDHGLVEPDTPLSSENTKHDSKTKKKDDERLYDEEENISDDEDKILKEFEKISKSLTEAKEKSIRIDSETSYLPGHRLAAERLKTPKAQPLEKELGLYINKVSSDNFQKDFYERAVTAFESRKQHKIKKIKEEKEKKEMEELVLKPKLNEDKNKKIKMSHEQRLMKFMNKKQKEINALKKELDQKRREEEMREATFQPSLVAKKKNEKLVQNLASKGAFQMAGCNHHALSNLEGTSHKAHVCDKKAKREDPMSFTPKILKNSAELRENIIRSTSPDVIQRLEILEARRQAKLSKAVSQASFQFKPLNSSSIKGGYSPSRSRILNTFDTSKSIIATPSSKAASSKVGVSSTKGSESGKGFLSAKNPKYDSPEQEAIENEGDYPLTENDVDRLLRELRENGNHLEEQYSSQNELHTPKKNSMANDHEELYKMHDNIRSIQENIEQLQDAFKKEILDDDVVFEAELQDETHGGQTNNTKLQKASVQTSGAKADSKGLRIVTPVKTSEPNTSTRKNKEDQKLAASREKGVPSLTLSKIKNPNTQKRGGPQIIYY